MTTKANTGTQDTTYNLLSIIYHALQGAETYEKYIHDAEQGGAKYVDQAMVLDGNLVTSRYWMDNHALLPQFLKMLKGR